MANRRRLFDLLADPDPSDVQLLDKASKYYRDHLAGRDVRAGVRVANDRLGTDFATAVLYAHFESCLRDWLTETSPPTEKPRSDHYSRTTLVIAPGAFHREHPETGGDGRAVSLAAKQHGWDCECLPTESLGTLDRNARHATEWFEKRRGSFVVVSLSKGTSDFMVALAQRPDLADRVVGWISLSGIVAGTPMSNWLLERKRLRPILWFMRWKHQADIQAVRDLRSGDSERLTTLARSLWGPVAARIPIFHLAGFPLKRHLSCFRARLWHRRFCRYGPNDSVVILEDLLDAPGVVIPVWGADHYLRSNWDSATALSALCQNLVY